jgi:hypothetical protein
MASFANGWVVLAFEKAERRGEGGGIRKDC